MNRYIFRVCDSMDKSIRNRIERALTPLDAANIIAIECYVGEKFTLKTMELFSENNERWNFVVIGSKNGTIAKHLTS